MDPTSTSVGKMGRELPDPLTLQTLPVRGLPRPPDISQLRPLAIAFRRAKDARQHLLIGRSGIERVDPVSEPRRIGRVRKGTL